MNHRQQTSALSVILCLSVASFCGVAWLARSSTAVEPRENAPQVVVLVNESVIQGAVEQLKDRLVVTNGPWYEIRVPIRDVDFVARDFNHAFRMKRRRLHDTDQEGHLKLAEWCLRNDQMNLAGKQLVHLVRIAPRDKAVQAFEQRLLARVENRKQPSVKFASHRGAVGPGDPEGGAMTFALPGRSDVAPELPPLPNEAVGQFKRFVQPLILNRCSQATCHGDAGNNSFVLVRGSGGALRRELTWRNLRAALEQIDSNRFDQSPLLLKAAAVHGGAENPPILAREDVQLRRLVNWVAFVTQHQQQEPPQLASERSIEPAPNQTPLARRLGAAKPSTVSTTHPNQARQALKTHSIPLASISRKSS